MGDTADAGRSSTGGEIQRLPEVMRGILAVANEQRLRRILEKMLDEREFLSPYGIRALSRVHVDHPYVFKAGQETYRATGRHQHAPHAHEEHSHV